MQIQKLIEDPVNRDIVGLLIVSNLLPRAKRVWLDLLPHMTDDEKLRLKKMMEDEVKYEMKVTEEAREKFLAEMEKLAQEA